MSPKLLKSTAKDKRLQRKILQLPQHSRKEQNTIDVVRTRGCSPLCLHLEKQQSKKRIFRTSLFNLCCTSSRFWKQACLQCCKLQCPHIRNVARPMSDPSGVNGDDSGLLQFDEHAFQEISWTFPKLQPTSAPEWWQPDLRSWIHLPGKICHMPHKFVATSWHKISIIDYKLHQSSPVNLLQIQVTESWHFIQDMKAAFDISKHSQSHKRCKIWKMEGSPRNKTNQNSCWASTKAIKDFRELSFRGTAQSSTKIEVPTNSNTSLLA